MSGIAAGVIAASVLAAGAALLFALFRLIKPKPPTWTRKGAVYLALGSLVFPFIVVGIVTGDREAGRPPVAPAPSLAVSRPAPAPPPIPSDTDIAAYAKGRSSKIEFAGIVDQEGGPLKGKLLRIAYTDKSAIDEESFILRSADDLRSIAEKITDRYQSHLSGLQIVLSAPTRDPRTGNTDTSIAFVLGYSMADLGKVNWPNFDYVDFLNLALVDAKSVGRKIAAAYCEGARAKRLSAAFCQAAAKG